MENEPTEPWHGAHHYSGKVHLFFIFFLFLAAGTIFWSYAELNSNRFRYKNSPTPTINPVNPTPTIKPTCVPRPSCLDTFPRCMIPETDDMCPPSVTPTPKSNSNNGGKACTQDAKLCPDGSYVGRTGPNCEFTACPSSKTIFCGGIAGKACPSGYSCKLDGNYPDAGGTCAKN